MDNKPVSPCLLLFLATSTLPFKDVKIPYLIFGSFLLQIRTGYNRDCKSLSPPPPPPLKSISPELAPNFYKFPMATSTRAPLNGNATLVCRPEGAPAPAVTWYRNGAELNVVDSGTVSASAGGRLTLTSLQASDAGRYTCKAENSLGVTETSTVLSIVGE